MLYTRYKSTHLLSTVLQEQQKSQGTGIFISSLCPRKPGNLNIMKGWYKMCQQMTSTVISQYQSYNRLQFKLHHFLKFKTILKSSNLRVLKSVTIHTYCMPQRTLLLDEGKRWLDPLMLRHIIGFQQSVCLFILHKNKLLLFSFFKQLNSRYEFTGYDQSK